jgi:hypothetical protein
MTAASSPEAVRLQQHLYTLAFADRMRQLQPFSPFPPLLPPSFTPRFCLPPDLAMFPLAKLDPRLFRINFPEEPKPQHSYIGLIAMAILSSPEKKLVLADIYQFVLDKFPYFRHRGHGWRNSIRHNLSINDCFVKAGRASNGKGHYWAVHTACQEDFQKGDFSRRKAQRKVRRHMGLNMEAEDDLSPPVSPSDAEAHPMGLDFDHQEPRKEFQEFRFPAQFLPELRTHVSHFTQLTLPSKSNSFSIDNILKKESA